MALAVDPYAIAVLAVPPRTEYGVEREREGGYYIIAGESYVRQE